MRNRNLNIFRIIIAITLYLILYTISINNVDISMKLESNIDSSSKIKLYYNNLTNGYIFDEDHIKMEVLEKTDSTITFKNIKLIELDRFRIDFEIENNKSNYVNIDKIYFSVYNIPIYKYDFKDIESFLKNDILVEKNNFIIDGNDSYIINDQTDINQIKLKLILINLFLTSIVYLCYILKIKKLINWDLKGIFLNYEKNKTEYILLICIFLILTIPNLLFFITIKDDIDMNENRNLISRPIFSLANLNTYPKDFELYYNDNIPLKSIFVRINNSIKYVLFKSSPADYVIKGYDEWLFYNSKKKGDADTLADYIGDNHFSEDELVLIKNKFLKMKKVVESKGAEFIIVIPPNKMQIYSEYMPIGIFKKNKYSRTDVLIKYLKDNTNLNIVYPKDEFLKYKDEYQLYFKSDTHWNDIGAYIAYTQIIGRKISNLNKLKISETAYYGDLANMINVDKRYINDKKFSIDNVKTYNFEIKENDENNFLRFITENKNEKKLLVFRDSFSTALIPFLNQNFEESVYIWTSIFDENLVNKENPDVVIYEMVERFVGTLSSP